MLLFLVSLGINLGCYVLHISICCAFNSIYFLISFETSLRVDYLEVSLIFTCLEDLLFFPSSWLFYLIIITEHILHDLNSFKIVELLFMAQDIVYLKECSINMWKEKCVLFFGWRILYISIRFNLTMCCAILHSYWICAEVLNHRCGFVLFFHYFHQILLPLFLRLYC